MALAFGAGLVSFTSPCCLPLLPGYLGYLTGLSAAEMELNRWRTLAAAALFVIGFTLVFVALGATASEVGAALAAQRLPLERIAGLFVLGMGLLLLIEGRIGILSRGGDWSRGVRGGRLAMGLPLGAAFAITWVPCIGPVLGVILTLAGATADLAQGVALLVLYSLGMALPLLALSLSVVHVRPWLRRLRRGGVVLQAASGGVLVVFGALLVSGRWLTVVSPILGWYAGLRWPPI